MASCKDCMHEEVCSIFSSDLNEDGAEKCVCFKNRNRFVELPCKVGDTIYEVFKYHKPPFIQQTKVEKIIVTEKGLKLKLARNSFYETSIASLGKTLFLTEEAAEARLKEFQEKQK